MKIFITLFLFLSCNKSLKELVNKNKIDEIYWQYVKEDKVKDLEGYLETNKIDFNKTNEEGETVLTLAAKSNSRKVINFLLNDNLIKEKIINLKNENGQTALSSSILNGSECLERNLIIRKFLNNGADVNLKYGAGCDVLMLAVIEGDVIASREILNRNININTQNLFGETALMLVIKSSINENKKIELLTKILEKNDIQINLQDKKGKSALTYAVINNNPKVVEMLTSRNDLVINLLDKENMTPFDYLNFEKFEIEVALNLIKKGSSLNNKDNFYETARKYYLEEIINFLIESKGDINYQKEGKNLMHWAILSFNSNMATSLRLAKYFIDKTKIDKNKIEEYIKYASSTNSNIFEVLGIVFEEEINLFNSNKEEREKIIEENFFNAILKEDIDLVNFLIEKAINLNYKYLLEDNPLIYASYFGNKEAVEMLLKRGVDVNVKGSYGKTALIISAQQANEEVVKILLEKGADINIRDHYGCTALIFASDRGHKNIVEILVKSKEVLTDAKDNKGCTALMYAVTKNHKEIVEILLEKGVDINIKDNNEETALLRAVGWGHEEIVKMLLEKGADVKIKGILGMTVLMDAASGKNKEVLETLFKRDIDLNDKDDYGMTALMHATTGRKEMMEILLEKGVDIDVNAKDKDGDTALILASKRGREDMVEILLEKGVNIDVNAKNNYGATALFVPAQDGSKSIIELLIKKGIDINATDNEGRTALFHPAEMGYEDSVEMLLEKGADVNIKDNQGWTVLTHAVVGKHKEVIELLIKKGINLNSRDNNGRTALMYAVVKGYKELVEMLIAAGADSNYKKEDVGEDVYFELMKENLTTLAYDGNEKKVKMLLEKGADINIKDKDGMTPLIRAVQSENKEMVELLIKANVDVNAKDNEGWTALMYAAYKGYNYIMKILIAAESDINYKDIYGKTILIIASENYGNKETLNLLIEKGIDVNTKDHQGKTALIYAIEKQDYYIKKENDGREVVEILIEAGAKLNIENYNELQVLILAISKGYKEAAKNILKQQSKYTDNKQLLIFFARTIEKDKDYALACRLIFEETIKDNIILQKSLLKTDLENKEHLKAELDKKIEFLKSLINLPLEVFELIVKFI